MNYKGLFKARYQLSGKDWIRRIDPTDQRVFIDIGLQANNHGQMGGRALYLKKGTKHMRKIGRIGAIMTNIRKEWDRMVREETERELGVTFDF